MAITVSIPSYEAGKPVQYEVKVEPGDGIAPYSVKRRYNDFLKLAKDIETEMGEPATVQPPPKPGMWESVDIECRRGELETMLTALVRVPEFAESLAVGNFLEIYTHRRVLKPFSATVDWVHSTSEISRLTGEARRSNDPSVLRQRTVQAKALVGSLQRGIHTQSLGAGESARRQQQLDGHLVLLRQLESRMEEMSTDPQDALFQPPISHVAGERVLGETAETRKLNNSGLMEHQQQVMADQEEAIEDIQATVARQKELGLAIHSEIQKQNELLDELDGDVHRVNARLNEARRKTSQLNR